MEVIRCPVCGNLGGSAQRVTLENRYGREHIITVWMCTNCPTHYETESIMMGIKQIPVGGKFWTVDELLEATRRT